MSHVIEERFDLAVRVGRLADTGLFATELGTCRMLVCASPEFLRTHVQDQQARRSGQAAVDHDHAAASPGEAAPGAWQDRATADAGACIGTIKTHSGIAAREFVRCGAGVGLLPDYAVTRTICAAAIWSAYSRLGTRPIDRPISAVFPSRDRLPTRVRLLIDFLRQSVGNQDPAAGPNGAATSGGTRP